MQNKYKWLNHCRVILPFPNITIRFPHVITHVQLLLLRALALENANVKSKGNLEFNPQNHLHWRMLNSSIANFFAILLQCNSKHRIAL